MYWRIKRVSKSFVTVDHGHPPLIEEDGRVAGRIEG